MFFFPVGTNEHTADIPAWQIHCQQVVPGQGHHTWRWPAGPGRQDWRSDCGYPEQGSEWE